jgi:integrase
VAKEAEKQRRRELEEGFHNLGNVREQRIRPLKDIIDEYLVGYRLRNRAPRFAKYALGHVSRLLGNKLSVDVDASAVLKYQEDRLREGAAPKSINEEVRFLLKMLGDPGEIARAQLRKEKQLKLKVRIQIGKAFDAPETIKLSAEVAKSRSPHIYMAFTLARNAGLRDAEIKTLTWGQINLADRFLTVGRAKTEAGEGRPIPFNDELYEAIVQHRAQYEAKFGHIQPSASGSKHAKAREESLIGRRIAKLRRTHSARRDLKTVASALTDPASASRACPLASLVISLGSRCAKSALREGKLPLKRHHNCMEFSDS